MGAVERALKGRKPRPMFMVDIAVPRDIEPEVAELRDVYLYTVDDLQEVIEENRRSRQEAAMEAEEIIDAQAEHFMGWLRSLSAVDTIRTYRENAAQTRDQVINHALQQLAKGKEPDEVIRHAARLLTNKLLHDPSSRLKRAAFDGENHLLDAARELFNIKDL
jgi:glutamyl-tRNA reductase